MGTAMGGMVTGMLVGPVGGLLFEWGGYRLPFHRDRGGCRNAALALAWLLRTRLAKRRNALPWRR
jgi:hypothetical protein